jgi:hypothetical protein
VRLGNNPQPFAVLTEGMVILDSREDEAIALGITVLSEREFLDIAKSA